MSYFTYFAQQFVNALSLGSIYALIAIGLSMVFSILRLINFAHGDLMMVGSYTILVLWKAGIPGWIAILGGILAAGLAGLLMERFAYRPLRGAPDITTLLTSFGVVMLLENSSILIFGPNSKPFRILSFRVPAYNIYGILFNKINVIIIVVSFVAFLLLAFFVKRTRIGMSMRAVADDLVASQLVGVRLNKVIVIAFFIGSALAGVAGLLWGARAGKIDPLMGFTPVIMAFIACVIGGFGSIAGAVLGGYVLGFAQIFFVAFLPPAYSGWRTVFVFVLLLAVLLLRPQGILGAKSMERRI